MTDLRKAAEMALEALEELAKLGNGEHYGNSDGNVVAQKAIPALRQALAQPEQEPVAVWELLEDGWDTIADADWMETLPVGTKLYTAAVSKPEQEPTLTEKDGSPCPEFWDWLPKAYNFEGLGEFTKYNMEVAFLAGKNTALAQPEQAPVAWIEGLEKPQPRCVTNLNYRSVAEAKAGVQFIPLYTSPQKREWQELTDEDWHNLPTSNKQGCERDAEIFNWIEDKLKEKNT